MIYLNNEKMDNGKIMATYGWPDGSRYFRDVLNIIVARVMTRLNLSSKNKGDAGFTDLTKQLQDAESFIYNCPAMRNQCDNYCMKGQVQGFKHELVIGLSLTPDFMTVQFIGQEDESNNDGGFPPFWNLAHYIQESALKNAGFRENLDAYKMKLAEVDPALVDALTKFEGTDYLYYGIGSCYRNREVAGYNQVSHIEPEELLENVMRLLKRGEYNGEKIGNVLLSNPMFVELESGDREIAVVFTQYTDEEAEAGYIGWPNGVVFASMQGDIRRLQFDGLEATFPELGHIEDMKFSTKIEDADAVDTSASYYGAAYSIFGEMCDEWLESGEFDEAKYQDYLNRIMVNVPEAYRPVYEAIGGIRH